VLPPNPPLTRRTTLLGAAAIGAASLLAACASGSPVGDNEPAELSVDEQAAVKARDAVAQTLAAVSATSTARPGLAVLLNPIAAMHDAHLSILDQGESGAASPDGFVVPPGRAGALAALHRSESELAALLAGLAAESESGQWARVLASMSAAVHQRLPGLAPAPGGKP